MANSGERNFGQELNVWVKTIGIFIAAVWAVYTFVYKEITVPKSAPVNITLNLDLKKIGTEGVRYQGQNKGLVPVEMKVSARNPGSREIHLLPSAWIAYGSKVTPKHIPPLPEKEIVSTDEIFTNNQMHSIESASSIVGVGSLFLDRFLKPNEITTRTLIIYIPPKEYDSLQVRVVVATVSRADMIKLDWKIGKNQVLESTVYSKVSGEWKEMKINESGAYPATEFELQMAHSSSELSLWQ